MTLSNTPPSDAIKPRPAPGAYLLESTKDNAEYWAKGARDMATARGLTSGEFEEVMQCYMQAANAWRNAAYGLAEKLHFTGYDPKLGTVALSEKAALTPEQKAAWRALGNDTKDTVSGACLAFAAMMEKDYGISKAQAVKMIDIAYDVNGATK